MSNISKELKETLQSLDCKVARELLKIGEEQTLNIFRDIPLYWDIAIQKTGYISYIQKERLPRFEGDVFNEEKRLSFAHMTKPGKFARKVLGEISDKELDKFNRLYKAAVTIKTADFRILEGEEISEYYHEDNYLNLDGTLGDSCMRYDSCQEYFEIYEDNCKMLCLFKGTYIKGRALVWETEQGFTFMDRIYTCDSSDEELFLEYAKKKGWAHKEEQTYSNGNIIYGGDTYYEGDVSVAVDISEYELLPYMDTFKTSKRKVLYNEENYDYPVLEDTGGNFTGYLLGDGERVGNNVDTMRCSITRLLYRKEDIRVYCNRFGECLNAHIEILLERDFEEHEGTYFHPDCVFTCGECGEKIYSTEGKISDNVCSTCKIRESLGIS